MESDDFFPLDLIDESIINKSQLKEGFPDLRIEKALFRPATKIPASREVMRVPLFTDKIHLLGARVKTITDTQTTFYRKPTDHHGYYTHALPDSTQNASRQINFPQVLLDAFALTHLTKRCSTDGINPGSQETEPPAQQDQQTDQQKQIDSQGEPIKKNQKNPQNNRTLLAVIYILQLEPLKGVINKLQTLLDTEAALSQVLGGKDYICIPNPI